MHVKFLIFYILFMVNFDYSNIFILVNFIEWMNEFVRKREKGSEKKKISNYLNF